MYERKKIEMKTERWSIKLKKGERKKVYEGNKKRKEKGERKEGIKEKGGRI